MKDNIEIVDKGVSISDREIETTMDFGGVLERYKAENLNNKITNGLTRRFIIFIGTLVFFGGAYLLIEPFILNDDPSIIDSKVEEEPKVEVKSNVHLIIKEEDKQEELVEESLAITEKSEEIIKSPAITNESFNNTPDKSDSEFEAQAEEEPSSSIYEYIDAAPMQGVDHLYQFLEANLRYPTEALNDSIEGSVMVQFTVSIDGKVTNINIQQSLGEYFDQEAVRLINSMPEWNPATINGKPVNSKVQIPLFFEIADSIN